MPYKCRLTTALAIQSGGPFGEGLCWACVIYTCSSPRPVPHQRQSLPRRRPCLGRVGRFLYSETRNTRRFVASPLSEAA